MELKFDSSKISVWKEALSSYDSRLQSLDKPDLVSLDDFYRQKLPSLLHSRNPNPYITTEELSQLMKWKLARGKWRPRLLNFVSSLEDSSVKSASEKAFKSLPDVSKAVSELTVLKGIGPATASAVLAAYAPDVAPFMSDEAMEAALGNSKDYSLKQYLLFATRLQSKAKAAAYKGKLRDLAILELRSEDEPFTPSDVERALWSYAIGSKLASAQSDATTDKNIRKKRKR